MICALLFYRVQTTCKELGITLDKSVEGGAGRHAPAPPSTTKFQSGVSGCAQCAQNTFLVQYNIGLDDVTFTHI